MRKQYLQLLLVLAFAVTLLPLPTAQARIISGYLTFENGSDGSIIAETIPGIEFTTDDGGGWFYGDVSTRRYNAPYPEDCSDRPRDIATDVCQYRVTDNYFAWVGFTGGVGRFRFTDGLATFVDMEIATGEDLIVVAFDANNEPLVATVVRPNTERETTGLVQLTAPARTSIAYVEITGSGFFWLLDNIATDAPGVPDQRIAERFRSAQIVVAIKPEPNMSVVAGGIVTYTIVTHNIGFDRANETIMNLPIRGGNLRVLDASFSNRRAWISHHDGVRLEIRTGPLQSGTAVTTTLRLQVNATLSPGTQLGRRISFSWDDRARDGQGVSNLPILSVGTTTINTPYYALASNSDSEQRSFSSPIFIPREPVALWYNAPDGSVKSLGRARADSDGNMSVAYDVSELPSGTYSVVAQGVWSGLVAVTQ
jgi:hypothetical protein